MPTFSQFALEALLVFWLLHKYYRLTEARAQSFWSKRWQLRLIPVLAFSLPLVPSLFLDENGSAISNGTQVMSLTKILEFNIPAFSISVGSLLLVVYFCGVLVSSFRLTDRLWLVHQFLLKNGNQPKLAPAWQAMPAAVMSNLVLNWRSFNEEEKSTWAKHWLPIHPIFAWEALLVELLLVLNWWNPLAYQYRASWAALFENWQEEQPQNQPILFPNGMGFFGLATAMSVLLSITPPSYSPTYRTGQMAANFFNKTVFEKKIEQTHEYLVEWGGLKIPLKKFANPNGYSAEIEVELVDFQQIIKRPLTVFKDGMMLKPGVLSIMYQSDESGTQAYINGIDPLEVRLLDRQKGVVFNDSLRIGDQLVLFGDTEDIYLSRIEFRIKDPNAGYEPAVFVPQINHLEATMPYQIVARRGQRTLVKIDPEHPNTTRILELYNDERQYEIVRIPGFRTNRHYLTEAESVASKVAAANSTLTFLEPDAYYLPEYQEYQNYEVRMVWGEMSASPSSPNYPLDSFLLTSNHEPLLLVGDDTLDIVSFQLIIAGKNRTAKSFETYRTGDLAIRTSLENVLNETSLFFEKIVVRDKNANQKLFPASFAFNIGNPTKHRRDHDYPKNFIINKGAKPEIIEAPFIRTVTLDSTILDIQKRMFEESHQNK